MKAWSALSGDTRGAVFVEHIIAFLPMMFFFLATWQLIELCAAQLIVKRAASAAARAAVVVLTDDYHFYDTPVNDFGGERKRDIVLAAAMILATSPHISSDITVEVSSASGSAPLTATVKANFHCIAGWVSIVCGGASRELVAKSTYAYQGADYDYDMGGL